MRSHEMRKSFKETTFHHLVHQPEVSMPGAFGFISRDGAASRLGIRFLTELEEKMYDYEIDRVEITKNGAVVAVLMS